ncbi:hypothetical protein Tco_1043822 [Tanacetum coccineum]|uniref:Xylulose kinase-1 n=1 Tax=Tanacetum coccineum TaxID=301880 RepID=A0ABQ5GQ66_9ASTR
MVACLERTDGNAEFHQIVDFLTTSPIHYALTVSPTIYASYIEQFWATAKSKTVNDVKQIHATVDGKTVVISESSVRSDLHFNDKDGIICLLNDEIFVNLALMGSKTTAWNEFSTNLASAVICLAKEPFNDVYVTPIHTKKVFTNMKRKNKDFSGTVTPLFSSMLVPQVVEGEGSRQPSEPQEPSSTAPPSHEEQVTTVASQSQKTHTPRRAKRRWDTEIPQSSGPPKKVDDEAIYTGEDDRVVRAATTATSLEAEQESGSGPKCQDTTLGDADAQTRFKTASKQSHDPFLSEVNTSGSGEDRSHTPGSDDGRPNINELMTICTQLSNRVLALENSKTAQDLVIKKLQKKVKRLEKKQRARTPGMKLFKIGTSKRKSLDKENVSKQGRNLKTRQMFEEGDLDDDTMNDKMENVEGDIVNAGGAVNTATTRVSTASASVSTASVSISTVEPRTPPTTTTTAFEDEDLTIAQTLVNMRSEKAKEKGVAFRDVEELRRSTPAPIAQPSSKYKGKAIMGP